MFLPTCVILMGFGDPNRSFSINTEKKLAKARPIDRPSMHAPNVASRRQNRRFRTLPATSSEDTRKFHVQPRPSFSQKETMSNALPSHLPLDR